MDNEVGAGVYRVRSKLEIVAVLQMRVIKVWVREMIHRGYKDRITYYIRQYKI